MVSWRGGMGLGLGLACAFPALVAARQASPAPVFLNINPSWAPDGRQIAFDSNRMARRKCT